MKIYASEVTASPVQLVPVDDLRSDLLIQNKSEDEADRIEVWTPHPDNLEDGVIIPAGGNIRVGTRPTQAIYAKSLSGNTIEVGIMEA